VRPFPGPGGKCRSPPPADSGLRGLEAEESSSTSRGTGGSRWPRTPWRATSFRAEKPRVWSPWLVPLRGADRIYDLHPDGERIAVLKASGEVAARRDKVVLFQNFFDELRRIAPAGRR